MNTTRTILLTMTLIATASTAFAQERAPAQAGSVGAANQIQAQERNEYRAPGNTQDIAPTSKETATGGQPGGLPNKN